MKFNINIEALKNIYVIANTAPFLITNFKNDDSIQELQFTVPITDLIIEFKTIADSEIHDMDVLVYAYALYIAILLKREPLSDEFLSKEGNINYEWFPEIKSVYLEKMRPTSVSTIQPITNSYNNSYKLGQNDTEDTLQEIN